MSASALHQQNTSAADYAGGLPAQFAAAGLLGIPLVIAGFITLWRASAGGPHILLSHSARTRVRHTHDDRTRTDELTWRTRIWTLR